MTDMTYDLSDADDRMDDVYTSDLKHCPRHPHVTTSTPDQMFDWDCGECEAEMYEDEQRRVEEAVAAMATPEWQAERRIHDTAAADVFLNDQIEVIRTDWRNGRLSSPDADAIVLTLQHARSYLWLGASEKTHVAENVTPDDILF